MFTKCKKDLNNVYIIQKVVLRYSLKLLQTWSIRTQHIPVAYFDLSLHMRKPPLPVSNKVRHKPACTVAEAD